MTYFTSLPKVGYRFGNEVAVNLFDDISVISDMVDDIQDITSFHEKYTIPQGERPDQTSYNFYQTTEYYWTFFLMNDHVRLQGWPLPIHKLEEKAKRDLPNTIVTTLANLSGKMKVGETITGNSSGTSGKIIRRHLTLGQLVIEGKKTFTNNETVTSSSGDAVIITGSVDEHLAIHHYEVDNDYVDLSINSSTGGLQAAGSSLVPITNMDRYTTENDSLKEIKVIKPSFIEQVSRGFKQAVRS